MGQKEQIQQKIDNINKAKAQAQTTHISMQTIKVNNMFSSLYDAAKPTSQFKKEILNLSVVLKEKLQFLAFGKPVIVEHEQDDALDLVDKLDLQEILFASIGDSFDYGVSRIIIEPIGKGKVQLRLADPNFPNVVRKIGRIPYEAEIWSVFRFERAKYWKRTIYREDYIYNDLYQDKDTTDGGGDFDNKKKVNIKEFNKNIKSESLQIKAKMKNTFKFIPVVEIPYTPVRDLSTNGFAEIAPKKRLEGLQTTFNEATAALRLERYLNRTKMLIDNDLIDSVSKDKLQKIADENILALVSDSGDADGKNKVVEIMQGDPKLTEYWLDITNTLSLAVQTLKLSELGETDSTTATDAIFNKGNDVETANVLGTFWQRKIAEILEKALAIQNNDSFTEADIDISKWGVQIVPNVIMNEAKMTDVVIAQLGAGLVNMVQAKVKLENISPKAATAQLDEEEKHYNPTLEATSSFGGDGDGDEGDGETGNPQPENKPNKE